MSPTKSPVNVLAEKDRNVTVQGQQQQQQQAQDGLPNKPEMKSLEHHRQVLQSKIQEGYAPSPLPATTTTTNTTTTTSCKSLFANPDLLPRHSQTQVYISPSDNIMSPCTAKLNALRGKQVCRYVTNLP